MFNFKKMVMVKKGFKAGCGCKGTDNLRSVGIVDYDDLVVGMFYYYVDDDSGIRDIVEYKGFEKGSGDVDCIYCFDDAVGFRLNLSMVEVLDSIHYVPDNLATDDDLLFCSVLVRDDVSELNNLFLDGWIVWDVFVGSNNYLVILKSDGEC